MGHTSMMKAIVLFVLIGSLSTAPADSHSNKKEVKETKSDPKVPTDANVDSLVNATAPTDSQSIGKEVKEAKKPGVPTYADKKHLVNTTISKHDVKKSFTLNVTAPQNKTKEPSRTKGSSLSAGGYLKGLQDKIEDMDRQITQVRSENTVLDKEITALANADDNNIIYYPKGTKKHVGKKYYEGYDYVFIGYGVRSTLDSEACPSITTLEVCLHTCFLKRLGDNTYNGIRFSGSICCCTKNEKGHDDNASYIHYKYFSKD